MVWHMINHCCLPALADDLGQLTIFEGTSHLHAIVWFAICYLISGNEQVWRHDGLLEMSFAARLRRSPLAENKDVLVEENEYRRWGEQTWKETPCAHLQNWFLRHDLYKHTLAGHGSWAPHFRFFGHPQFIYLPHFKMSNPLVDVPKFTR